MKEEKTTPLRQRMIEDMHIRGLCEKSHQGHIRCVKHFASFLGRSPDTATPEDLRAYQLQMTKELVSATMFNVRIIPLRFFFSVTCGREEMRRYMQFHRQPRKLPVVLSVEEVAKLLASVPGPGLKYRAALGISYGAGLRASEVCNLKVRDIDSQRMLIHVDQGKGSKDRQAMLSPSLLEVLRQYWRESRSEVRLFPGRSTPAILGHISSRSKVVLVGSDAPLYVLLSFQNTSIDQIGEEPDNGRTVFDEKSRTPFDTRHPWKPKKHSDQFQSTCGG